jgi:hypothetical protein
MVVGLFFIPHSQLACLQLLTPDALTRSGDSARHIQRGISRILRARAYLDLLAFCRPSPSDYMRVIFGSGRGAFSICFSLHMSPFSRCHPIAILYLRTGCWASMQSAPTMFGSAHGAMKLPKSLAELDLRRRYRAPLFRVSAPQHLCLWITSPGIRALGTSFNSTMGLSTCLKNSCSNRGLLSGGTCGCRSTVLGRELLEIDAGVWSGYTLGLHAVILLLM